MDEQLKNLRPDEDDLDERAFSRKKSYQQMDTGHAIILAALIIVGGLWGGKLYYDHVQEQKMVEAFELAGQMFKNATAGTLKADKLRKQQQMQLMEKRRLEAMQELRENEQRKQTAQENAALEKKRTSDECRFWWDQNTNNPTEKTAINKAFYCDL